MLGEYVKKYRLQRGYNMAELAEKVGCSRSFISQVEKGQANPSVATLKKIADALGVSVEILSPSKASLPRDEEEKYLHLLKTSQEYKQILDQVRDMTPQDQAQVVRMIEAWKKSK